MAFAGIALIWIFKTEGAHGISLPSELLWPAMLFIVGLGFDLLHYLVASATWGTYHRVMERKYGPGYASDLHAPAYLNWPSLLFYWGKLVAVIWGYALLLAYVVKAIRFEA